MAQENIKIAICYDFDGTLIRGNMQENSFIPGLNIEIKTFWKYVRKEAKEQDMDEILAYMELMIEKAKEKKQSICRQSLQKHGLGVELFPGVGQWFDIINQEAAKSGITLEHFVISSGIDEMIKGSPIGNRFKHIFASGFSYDADDIPKFVARSVNYTTKTQYLFRINKGVLNSWDNSINESMAEDERPMPFSRIIYLGDGKTDVPTMKMLNYQGGYSIAVFPPKKGSRITEAEQEKKELVEKLKEDNRAKFVAEADYRQGSDLYQIVRALIHRISDEELYKMNRKA